MNPITRNIPNSITCLNLLAGCMAIAMASRASAQTWGLPAYQWAFIFIAAGAVADFFDGFAARALRAYSELGKELDSLCDLVTFGVAPAMIVLNLFQESAGCGSLPEWLGWCSLLIPVSGALRLARFNIDTRQTTTFIGLPIPANAIFWIGYASLYAGGVAVLGEWFCFLPVLLAECWLMNSPVRMYSLKMKSLRLAANWPRYLLVVAAAVFCAFLGVGGLLWLIVFYIGLSLAVKPD